jgi:hypothetical protein
VLLRSNSCPYFIPSNTMLIPAQLRLLALSAHLHLVADCGRGGVQVPRWNFDKRCFASARLIASARLWVAFIMLKLTKGTAITAGLERHT